MRTVNFLSAPVDMVISDRDATHDPAGDALYFIANTSDPENDLDGSVEFQDSDGSDELAGLTIVEPAMGSIRRWLKGYDVL
jgi:hypothetical protein